MQHNDFEETPAEIARRRLAELAATFNATLPDPVEDEADVPVRPGPKRFAVTSMHVRFMALLGVVALVAIGWWLLSGSGSRDSPGTNSNVVEFKSGAQAESSVGDASTASKSESSRPVGVIVHVAGKVKNPGLVTLDEGARVADAIEGAGGVVGKPNLNDLNLARKVTDGEQIRVGLGPPLLVDSASASGASGGASAHAPSGVINLNTASQAELETLPGVGPVTAKAILDWRTENDKFSRVEDLLDVRGIGEATLAKLRPLVSV